MLAHFKDAISYRLNIAKAAALRLINATA